MIIETALILPILLAAGSFFCGYCFCLCRQHLKELDEEIDTEEDPIGFEMQDPEK